MSRWQGRAPARPGRGAQAPGAADVFGTWPGLALAALGGLLQAGSFSPTEAWWLQIPALALLAALASDAPARMAALRVWLFHAVWLGSGTWWLFNSLHLYGGLPALVSVAAVALLACLLALYGALAGALFAWWRRGSVGADALLFAALWLLSELAQATLFTGFPWIATGYAHTAGPLAGWAPWVGVYGIGALAAGCAAVPGLALRRVLQTGRRRYQPLGLAWACAVPAVLALIGVLLPQDFTRSTGVLRVTLLQSNVPQDLKFDKPHIEAALDWHARRLAEARGQLVLAPESSLPVLMDQITPATWRLFEQPFKAPGRGALIGLFLGNEERGYTNSLLGLSSAGNVSDGRYYHYGKRHLLPFGEFLPTGLHWFVEMLQIPLGDQASGTVTAPFVVAGQRVRPLICYEDLFGEDYAAAMVGPDAATLTANVSNLAWFGPLMVQDQHLQFSRMRALEFQRGQVRATNTGATAVVDHRGRITARLPPDVEGVLDAEVEGRTGDTPYGRWLARWGLAPLWAAALLVLALVGVMRKV